MKLKGLFNFLLRPLMFSVNVEFWREHDVIHHYSWSYQDALQWASCYPNECVVNIRRFSRVVAMVGQR